MTDQLTGQCVVCRFREAESGLVCAVDRKVIRAQLTEVGALFGRLDDMLVPGSRSDAEPVTTSRTGSPMPANGTVLSLLGPGSVTVTQTLNPTVRHWCTAETVDVAAVHVDPQTGVADIVTTRRMITRWHRELVRDADGNVVTVVADDQVGVLPPVAWAQMWAAAWRHRFSEAAPVPRHRSPVEHLDDDLRYLRSRTDSACELDREIVVFAGELRALHAELSRVVGDRTDQVDLGRCPARITRHYNDQDELVIRPCGAGLWKDPHVSTVQCPMCRSAWGPKVKDLIQLATDIRRTWPVDRRRRYTDQERVLLRTPRCRTCNTLAVIAWRNVTGTGDTVTKWQAISATCPQGCDTETLL